MERQDRASKRCTFQSRERDFCIMFQVCFVVVAVGAVGGGMPEAAGGERRHVPLYGRLVAEEQLASMSAPSDIQVSAPARNPRAFCRYPCRAQVNDARGSLGYPRVAPNSNRLCVNYPLPTVCG